MPEHTQNGWPNKIRLPEIAHLCEQKKEQLASAFEEVIRKIFAVLPTKFEKAPLKDLAKLFAILTDAYLFLRTNRQVVQSFIEAHPSLLKVCIEVLETLKDDAESALYDAIQNGKAWAISLYLKTQAKDRGYVERQESQTVEPVKLCIVEEIIDSPPQQSSE